MLSRRRRILAVMLSVMSWFLRFLQLCYNLLCFMVLLLLALLNPNLQLNLFHKYLMP